MADLEFRLSENRSSIIPEIYFLISKFLSEGPLHHIGKAIIEELEKQKVLPKRYDWTGQEHEQSFSELERKYPHIGPEHLLNICARIGPILDKELLPSVPGIHSLLGAGRQNLLRTVDTINRSFTLTDYCTRLHQMPLSDATTRRNTNNLVQVLVGREAAGPITRRYIIQPNFYSKMCMLRRTLGHLSAVYCVLFDRSGRYIITGADDLLVKLWSAIDGRLFTTFRGASAEITDIAVNLDNTLLAAGSIDRILRVWDMQTAAPIAVLTTHTGMITSVNFCPSPKGEIKFLVTTSTDGSVAFWQYSTPKGAKPYFAPKPNQYMEKIRPGQAQMICASFSPGGIFLAAGSADHHVRVYVMSEEGPHRILETEAHSDTVDSIQWAHSGLRFVSGGKDGVAFVWTFECQQWKSMKLNMADRLETCPTLDDETKKLKVTMVSWDYSDKWVITAVNDNTIKVWDSVTGKLRNVLRGHTDELYVLESHPKDSSILLSAGHDGQLFLWDIMSKTPIASFVNRIDGQGNGSVFDAKWSPDGTMIAATDSHGHILMYGFGSGHERLKLLPKELFFHTDYRPLIRDVHHFVMDEQTQTVPHLMPPPFLVDVDGNPHPPTMQRMVPGRENCPTEQLIPNIAIGPEGMEVMDQNNVSHIDRLIEALANRNAPGVGGGDGDNNVDGGNRLNSPRLNGNANRIPLRRLGEIEGVRQSSGNWQRESSYKWIRRMYVRPMSHSALQAIRQRAHTAGHQEQEIYRREMRRRPLMINTANMIRPVINDRNGRNMRRNTRRGGANGNVPAYRTRAVREREPTEEREEEQVPSSSSSSGTDSSDCSVPDDELMSSDSSSSDSESSEYSDWVADKPGTNLEPPTRSKRKPVQRRAYSPADNSTQNSRRKTCGRRLPGPNENGEIPELYRPTEWLTEVIPRKAPYYPQMGDEVVYFRQGHQRYLDAVRNKNLYKLNNNSEPWNQMNLRDHEFVKVIGIKYEIRPPRLCCLKMGKMDDHGKLTGQSFTIKYHDIPDVLDFIVLQQTFNTAVSRNWSPGDRFRCMIDDGWWQGQIEELQPISDEFPDSLFMCFRIRWDNGEYECMSPWDMEPIDENRVPREMGGSVPVLPEELRATLYQPKSEEWPRGDREASCRRIVAGMEHVMSLAIADPFLAPVDLNIYPSYAYVVEYPIDLATIKARFENHFYRRITSAQFDIRYLATNAEKFNQSHSNIVKQARIITDLCLRIIKNPNDIDVGAVYHQLVDTYITSDSDQENQQGTSSGTATRPRGSRRSRRLRTSSGGDWRSECKELLEYIWQQEDATPFREPVDPLEHLDYLQIIESPMDLRTIREDLNGGNYETPNEFIKDMRLIFQNSRNYNTNKRSRIYAMTLRLSNLFESSVKPIVSKWKKQSHSNNRSPSRTDSGLAGTSRVSTRGSTSQNGSRSSDISERRERTVKKIRRRTQRRRGYNNGTLTETIETNVIVSSSRRRRIVRGNPANSLSAAEGSSESGSESSDDNEGDGDSDDSNASTGGPSPSGSTRNSRQAINDDDDDSEESYRPNQMQNKRRRNRRNVIDEVASGSERYDSEESYRPQQKKLKSSSRPSAQKKNGIKRNAKKNGKINGNLRTRRNQISDDASENEDVDVEVNSNEAEETTNDSDNTNDKREDKNGVDEVDSEDDDDDNDSDHPMTDRRRSCKYESDQSFQMSENRNKLRLESDTEREVPRSTRNSIRRAQLAWARDDSLEEDEDDICDEDYVGSSYNSRSRNHSSRKRKSKRHQTKKGTTPQSSATKTTKQRNVTESEDEDDDDDEDNMPLINHASTNGAHSRSARYMRRNEHNYANGSSTSTSNNHSLRNRSQLNEESDDNQPLNRYQTSAPTTSRRTTNNSQSTSLVQPEPESSISSRRSAYVRTSSIASDTMRARLSSNVSEEHNYGEPGPSTLRHTRRNPILSRHQRNADELDHSVNGPIINTSPGIRSTRQHPVINETENRQFASSDAGHSSSTSTHQDYGLGRVMRTRVPNHSNDRTDTTNGRSTRNLKRLHYNEDSDDSDDQQIVSKRNRKNTAAINSRHATSNTNDSQPTEESEEEPTVSISSRGRVRKITAKARGLFRE